MVIFIPSIVFFISLEQKKKFKYHEKICKNKDFCGTVMPSEKSNKLESNQYMK